MNAPKRPLIALNPDDPLRESKIKALIALDIPAARCLAENPGGLGVSDETALLSLHQMRYECTVLDAELRHASAHWLHENGYTRLYGYPLLDEGGLPS